MTGYRRALGMVLLMEALAPFGDMINVLAHHGSVAAAFGIHGLTSAVIALCGLLFLRETSRSTEASAPAPDASAPASHGRGRKAVGKAVTRSAGGSAG